MSELEVKVVRLKIEAHPNADRLQIGKVVGSEYSVVVGKDQFKDDDLAILVLEDSVVPPNIQDYLATTQKIAVNGGRIRCSKIRGYFSDGLCLTPSQWLPPELVFEGSDVKEKLGITKYEPPEQHQQGMPRSKGINHNYVNENFKRYTSIDNFKKYSRVLQDGEEVVITKKFHGSNHRAGIVSRPKGSITLLEKVKNFFGLKVDMAEYLVGSHNTIRQRARKAEQVEDVYRAVADKYNMKSVLSKLHDKYNQDIIIFSELVGKNVQVGYDYGVPESTHELRVFDIMFDGYYLNWDDVVAICSNYNLPMVDVVYRGAWDISLTKHAEAIDEYNGKKYVREGIVIKPTAERKDPRVGRVILKYISETFRLDKKNSGFH